MEAETHQFLDGLFDSLIGLIALRQALVKH